MVIYFNTNSQNIYCGLTHLLEFFSVKNNKLNLIASLFKQKKSLTSIGPSAGTLFLHEWEFENRLLPRAPCFSHDLAVLSSASVQIQCPCQNIVDLCISFDVILYIKFLHLEKDKIVFKLQTKIDSKK